MSNQDRMTQLRGFLGQFIATGNIDPDDNLFSTGLVNSLFAMQLVLYVEKEFGIQVGNEDLDVENFKSLNAINGFIDRKLGPAG